MATTAIEETLNAGIPIPGELDALNQPEDPLLQQSEQPLGEPVPEWFMKVEAAVDKMKANLKGSISPKDDINELIKELRDIQTAYGKKKTEEGASEQSSPFEGVSTPSTLL